MVPWLPRKSALRMPIKKVTMMDKRVKPLSPSRADLPSLAWQWSKLLTCRAVLWSHPAVLPWVAVRKPELSQGQQQFGTNPTDSGKCRTVLPWPQNRNFYVLQGWEREKRGKNNPLSHWILINELKILGLQSLTVPFQYGFSLIFDMHFQQK